MQPLNSCTTCLSENAVHLWSTTKELIHNALLITTRLMKDVAVAVRPYCLAYADVIRTMILSRFGTHQLENSEFSDDDFEIICLGSIPKM
ncbi:unnamed protein product [Acanthoscelides obtectus]|uniref:Uncharacterized protein n=1 Tax=Acanthoscelides obtectus TaxID=200917 RepID=A0A9P0P7K4_ACAOB|nr:unnamed protein product [Acanthoscelides obtectus]CAK1635515.1 hypothetical protein AOBTE_LOCUS9330 [Acanthoscelides obtectus]